MTAPSWSVQDAKNKFSAVVDAAQHEPQLVTKHGKPAAVVISSEEYTRLKQLIQSRKPAKNFVEHLLSIPQSDEDENIFERLPVKDRNIEL